MFAKKKLKSIISNFNICGEVYEIKPYGSGHINNTFLTTVKYDRKEYRYILQQINSSVFKNPSKMMESIQKLLSHLEKKLKGSVAAKDQQMLTLILSKRKLPYYCDADGAYWRVLNFIKDSFTVDLTDDLSLLFEAGKCIGAFHSMLADFDCKQLHVSIPHFHDTEKRIEQFKFALNNNAHNRAEEIKKEIDFIIKRSNEISRVKKIKNQGQIKEYAVHNDTKLNNILFDLKKRNAICLIDLDTVMPGLRIYDFGEIMRTGASSADEDEKDLKHVFLDLEKFESIAAGYLFCAGQILAPAELELLPLAAKLMAFENGVRFLTDYLGGNHYFKIKYPDHNLYRCRSQFKLVRSIEEKTDKMTQIINKYK